jgi:hypothetical protein
LRWEIEYLHLELRGKVRARDINVKPWNGKGLEGVGVAREGNRVKEGVLGILTIRD